jgi:hypothetical protein
VTDVSGQHISPIFKGQAVQELSSKIFQNLNYYRRSKPQLQFLSNCQEAGGSLNILTDFPSFIKLVVGTVKRTHVQCHQKCVACMTAAPCCIDSLNFIVSHQLLLAKPNCAGILSVGFVTECMYRFTAHLAKQAHCYLACGTSGRAMIAFTMFSTSQRRTFNASSQSSCEKPLSASSRSSVRPFFCVPSCKSATLTRRTFVEVFAWDFYCHLSTCARFVRTKITDTSDKVLRAFIVF